MALDEATIRERVLEMQNSTLDERAAKFKELAANYRHIRPFSGTYSGIIEALESNDDNRFRLGIAEIDLLTRGIGPKELALIVGFSHSGKTQLVNTAICNNRDKRVLFFSFDDPAEMILLKLTCMHEGISAEVLEQRIRQHDEEAKLMLKAAATESFGNLLVVDEGLSLRGMTKAVAEATDMWQAPPDAIIVDYLQMMVGDEEGGDSTVDHMSKQVKRWAMKQENSPTLLVHQTSRSGGGPGAPITITSGAFGGEAVGTMMIGVRRKRDNRDLEPWDRENTHRNTVTLHLAKNKRPPAKVTPYEGVDCYMDPDTGMIRSLRDGDITYGSTPKAEKQREVVSLDTLEQIVDAAKEKAHEFDQI
jgi:KaiC/GvpD/RAD55 family RecA-like ATPase